MISYLSIRNFLNHVPSFSLPHIHIMYGPLFAYAFVPSLVLAWCLHKTGLRAKLSSLLSSTSAKTLISMAINIVPALT